MMTPQKEPMGNAAFRAGLIAGTLDATGASVQAWISKGLTPVDVFQYVASGAFGKQAYTGNTYGWAACGLVFHFLIAICFAFLFFMLYKQFSKLLPNAFVAGVVYGLLVWCVMNLAVVPLAFGKPIKIVPEKAAIAAAILVAAIGIPVSLLAKRYYMTRK